MPAPETQCPKNTGTLWTPEFLLLFLLSVFANSYIAIFYSFEHWLVQMHISPHWRGILLAAMGFSVLCMRPVASVWLLRHKGLILIGIALTITSLLMMSFSYVHTPQQILLIRFGQGVCFAAMHSAVVNILVQCIPPGQSARSFAMFSLTMLLPVCIIPTIAEYILPYVSDEAVLYKYTALLGIPSFICLCLLWLRLKKHPLQAPSNISLKELWYAVGHSGLLPAFLSCLLFGSCIVTINFFMKSLCVQKDIPLGNFFMASASMIIFTRLVLNNRIDMFPRTHSALAGACIMIVCVFGFALGPTWSLLPLAGLYGIGVGVFYPMIAAIIYDASTPTTRSINSNVMMLCFDASYVLGPLMGGTILEYGLNYTYVILNGAFVMFLACVLIHIFMKNIPKATDC